MAQMFYPTPYPPLLSQAQSLNIKSLLGEWAQLNGVIVRPQSDFLISSQKHAERDDSSDSKKQDLAQAAAKAQNLAITAPVTLFPSLFVRSCYDEARSIQTSYNEVYARIVMNEAWLGGVVKEIVEIDDFIAKLWDVHLKVKDEGYAQDLALGLFRSDYMIHLDRSTETPKPIIRQVEFNTIASSFGGLASKVSSLHKYLSNVGAYPEEASTLVNSKSLPNNHSIEGLAKGLAQAQKAYGKSKSSHDLCVLFIVQDGERNVFDAKHLEYELLEKHGVKAFRLPFGSILHDTKLDHDRTLLYSPPSFPSSTFEATTVYYRAGYSPSEYDASNAWEARLHLERSAAIKCPSILTHLAGSKKIQQILATPGSSDLERFLSGTDQSERVQRLKRTFAPMYPLDGSAAGKEARELALNPDTAQRYVVKPQREGGGNNIYRKAIPQFLKNTPEEQWPAHILMEMIETPPQRNYILRNGEVQEGGVICELGIYGACVWRSNTDGEILFNEEAGSLLRTKGDSSEEGGVAAGFGAVDSCCLVDL